MSVQILGNFLDISEKFLEISKKFLESSILGLFVFPGLSKLFSRRPLAYDPNLKSMISESCKQRSTNKRNDPSTLTLKYSLLFYLLKFLGFGS